ncbi:MAG: DNA polymerase III subunit gamma/tau [Microcoleus sp. PH2017_10_PVI_O_A]|uniref:DNA polymerase III subunit gamma/tau n=1 Tax=unclassified Microcoleus TaxID=2642155 RepID=UPI001D6C2F5D|nr:MULTISPECIES: DNA polymerase III subunit gamma/tau [unclassified Microcoleus]TAE83466.1 MAG: DNA polymerase III subunit gamma/tau [Oscillatoriales cyanobacterium]MCC3404507.1 DNA polymerase III subunit gamma/tau [Microcoleus sp. PH2017_10_PVI_O_A]MCC3458575.1 DNA polymerase III subunit gamma/tau [Microcoleus sp. PH2017_11_PCY_U_A]MCC3476825.1 DNA polymerase III subunit gamma/tau [Microcoleus sp. PH2017_12_PCY_D_A]MCC3526963.1 DNA polymerase III subunit gamma/tau [Microcoleus sp. PH2017_21_R
MTYEPLHHKYRPQTFAELVGQEAIAQTLTSAILQQRIAPAYLFTGPRGTGKTSSARIFAKSLNCISTGAPTPTPCGKCNVCQEIARGSTLDVIEIDAASNTGVDNIRDLIERAQFAPVQCRYKVYVIDECLSGDSHVQTSEGLMRIDNPNIKGKQVLSYNETSETWEFKKVLRWLDQGKKQTLLIKTANREIRCTANHPIRTEQGWILAKDVKEGVKILSPVNVGTTALCSADIPVSPLVLTSLTPKNYLYKNHPIDSKSLYTPALKPVENGCQTLNSIQSLQWITNSETVASVKVAGVERVYDIEVEDNHNFVANGLCTHNCHMLTVASFNALLKTLEEPPDRVVFVLATTDPQRVLPTIISRCQKFDFRRIPLDSMTAHLHKIAQLENINIASDAVQMVAQIAQGGLRDAESLLDQLSLFPGQITVEKVWDLVGAVPENDLMELLQAIANDNATALIDMTRHLMDRGREPLIVLQSLASFYRDLLIASSAPKRSDLVALTAATWEKLCDFARSWDAELILASQKHLQTHEVQIKNTTQPRLWLEVTLLGLLPSAIRTQPQPAGEASQNSGQSQIHPPQPPQASGGSSTAHIEQPPAAKPQNTPPTSQPIVNRTESTPPAPIPEAIPTPETNQTNYSPTNSADEMDLNRVWEQVLAKVRPFSTQVLLRQHGNLVIFTNNTAYVKIRAPKLLNTAKDKVANIEEAFLQVFNRQVTVKVGLTNPAETNSSRAQDLQNYNGRVAEIPGNLPAVSNDNQQVEDSGNSEIADDFLGNGGEEQKHSWADENTATNVPNVSEPLRQINSSTDSQNELNAQAVAVRADARSVANTSRQWADMFEGQVVDLSDDLEIWESGSFSLETEEDFPELSSEVDGDDFIDW